MVIHPDITQWLTVHWTESDSAFTATCGGIQIGQLNPYQSGCYGVDLDVMGVRHYWSEPDIHSAQESLYKRFIEAVSEFVQTINHMAGMTRMPGNLHLPLEVQHGSAD